MPAVETRAGGYVRARLALALAITVLPCGGGAGSPAGAGDGSSGVEGVCAVGVTAVDGRVVSV
jgi:hypothetical protein